MHWLRKTALSLTCALAMSSCATGGKTVLCPAPLTPQARPIPVDMLKVPTFEQQAQDELLEPVPKPTPGSDGSSES